MKIMRRYHCYNRQCLLYSVCTASDTQRANDTANLQKLDALVHAAQKEIVAPRPTADCATSLIRAIA